LIYILGGLLLLITAAFGWSLTRGYDEKKEEVQEEAAATKKKEPGQDACASNATYARLKEVAFEEAQKLAIPIPPISIRLPPGRSSGWKTRGPQP
jgi:hypothetical protein